MRIVTRAGARAVILAVAVTAAVIASPSAAAPADADFQVDIGIAMTFGQGPFPAIPNGGTATVYDLNFLAGVRVTLIPAQPESSTLRVELADGLSWGADKPATTANCTGTATTAECNTMPFRSDPAGDTEEHFGWNVVAAKLGRYTVKAAITGGSTPDPNLSNNSASVTVVVAKFSVGGGATTASKAKVSPAHPTAGSLVSATVRIIAAGPPVRPRALRCTGNLGRAKLSGTPRARSGTATCLYRPPHSAKGKTLRGVVSFTVGSTKFARRFSVRLG
jgi:hypothetical protein